MLRPGRGRGLRLLDEAHVATFFQAADLRMGSQVAQFFKDLHRDVIVLHAPDEQKPQGAVGKHRAAVGPLFHPLQERHGSFRGYA